MFSFITLFVKSEWKAVHKTCLQHCKVLCKLFSTAVVNYRVMNVSTDRQTDRREIQEHAQARTNKTNIA